MTLSITVSLKISYIDRLVFVRTFWHKEKQSWLVSCGKQKKGSTFRENLIYIYILAINEFSPLRLSIVSDIKKVFTFDSIQNVTHITIVMRTSFIFAQIRYSICTNPIVTLAEIRWFTWPMLWEGRRPGRRMESSQRRKRTSGKTSLGNSQN